MFGDLGPRLKLRPRVLKCKEMLLGDGKKTADALVTKVPGLSGFLGCLRFSGFSVFSLRVFSVFKGFQGFRIFRV